MMTVHIVFPVLPPVLDGIGDHTACFAEALTPYCEVRVLTAQETFDEIPEVEVERAFSVERPRDVRKLLSAVQAKPPNWLFLQFNQFSYGRWGLNPYLPFVIREIKRTLPEIRIAWMAHEDFVPPNSWKFALMSPWQRWQFWMLGRHADLILFSIEPWVQKYKAWFPRTPVKHLPVSSNIPLTGATRQEARQRIGLRENIFVAGVFGTLHTSRMIPLIRSAAEAIRRKTDDILILYIGPDGEALRAGMDGLPMKDMGRRSAEEVSSCFAAMDVHLAPFIDGVSTRRGSFMAGMQHGIPTVSTEGKLTDDVLRQAHGKAFLLASVGDPDRFTAYVEDLFANKALREGMGQAGRAFFEAEFAWDVSVRRFLRAIESVQGKQS